MKRNQILNKNIKAYAKFIEANNDNIHLWAEQLERFSEYGDIKDKKGGIPTWVTIVFALVWLGFVIAMGSLAFNDKLPWQKESEKFD